MNVFSIETRWILPLLFLTLPLMAAGNTQEINRDTVAMPHSELMWLRNADLAGESNFTSGAPVTPADAKALVAQLNAGAFANGGFTDWRLPTTDELQILFASVSADDPGPFKNVRYGHYQTLDRKGVLDVVRHGQAKMGTPNLIWPVRAKAALVDLANTSIMGLNSVWLRYNSEVISGDVIANNAYSAPIEVHVESNDDPDAPTILYDSLTMSEHASTAAG